MARPERFPQARILDATARLAARVGPAGATVAAIAAELAAPTGSIYHRYASRDLLLAEVWLRAAASFQAAFLERLEEGPPWQAGLDAALSVASRARAEPIEARILLLHRREDFGAAAWPDSVAAQALELTRQLDAATLRFARRLCSRTDAEARRALHYALAGAPLAAIRPHLREGGRIPATVEPLIEATWRAVTELLGVQPSHHQHAAGDR